jgi:hypothetical protein
MKVFRIITIECPTKIGGAVKASQLAEKLVSRVGGLSSEEYEELATVKTSGNQVTVLIRDESTALRVLHWKHHMKQVMLEHEKHRQISGFMVHTTRPVMIGNL